MSQRYITSGGRLTRQLLGVPHFWWCLLSVNQTRSQLASHFDLSASLMTDWSAMLSKPKYAAFASYLTGWLGTVGNWT